MAAAAAAAAATAPVGMHVADYNVTRLAAYVVFFEDLFLAQHDEFIAVNLLTDVSWAEVSRGFVCSLTRRCAAGPLRPLAADVGALLRQCAVGAFGTDAHERMPSWFLQNYETFLASSAHKLLRHYTRKAVPPVVMERAFGALLQVAEGMRCFVGLQTVRSGAHALLMACHHSRTNLLAMESSSVCAPHLAFVELLAEAILREPERSVCDRHNSLSFFAKSDRWQLLSRACAPWLSRDSRLAFLNAEIARGVARAERAAADIPSLATAFLATSPPRQRRVAVARTPTKPKRPVLASPSRAAIRKRPTPFEDLVRKLADS